MNRIINKNTKKKKIELKKFLFFKYIYKKIIIKLKSNKIITNNNHFMRPKSNFYENFYQNI